MNPMARKSKDLDRMAEKPACVRGFRMCTVIMYLNERRSGTSDGLFLPIYPPRSMRVMLGFDDL